MTDSALKKNPLPLPRRGDVLSFTSTRQKKSKWDQKLMQSDTALLNRLTVCPDTQQRLKSKLLVEMLKEGTLRRHRDQRGGSLSLSFTRGPQKP